MKRKVSADSGTMPISGKEQPGALARQSNNSSSVLPCKKRWYSLLYSRAPIHASRNVEDLVKPALAEKLAGREALGTEKVSVKKKVVPKQGESHSKLELPADSGHSDKGKHVVGASEQEFNFPISSIHPSLRHKSANVIRVSLGSTFRGFDLSVLQSKSEPVEEALLQANEVDTAAKELNVCSDKVEASVPASMNEDHKVYKKTQDTYNLVASGEGSANDGEKIIKSVGTERLGCVGQDEECEEGEIREYMMQSIVEDPMTKGIDSGKNSEPSSKNVHSSLCFTNAESHEDFVKACDEKAEKDLQNVAVFRPETGRPLPSRSGRERYSYMEEEIFHLQRNRDEIYGYGPKFVRDRFQDSSFGSSRGDFMHGRGRGWGRGRYSGPDFERFGGVADYPFRHKRTAPAWESADERNDYDGAAFGTNRRRKPLNDDLPSLRHPPARRQSPNGREDAAMMGTQRLRRAPSNISPRRGTDKDGFAYVDIRHGEKFDRHFPADRNSHLAQGDTEITAMQRSGFPRMRSKSPIRSRTWSLPPRRLTEELYGRQHRSPVKYREDRTRPSSRTSFTEEAIAPQRRDPPSYSSHRQSDRWDVDGVQEYGHPRSHYNRGSAPDRERADSYGERQMRNVKEQEGGGNRRRRHEEEFDGSRLKKRRF
ncbi:uncharacterized protein LOC107017296 [Solanum pennellii]|uniref:Uncharacterized protein LOC107017296 n=1 Tax=Solanum pennellii TaxID=28526 RepID=A0ABM1GLY2_SOLPN|nr:uncharacterized protein LOC107017296 [Solanum pennellii]